jgi:hypothetical protein
MKKAASLLATLLFTGASAYAGREVTVSRSLATKEPLAPEEQPYHASRGTITLEGPSGMFLNPTSATLPKGRFTIQTCRLFQNRDTDIVGWGGLVAYGVTDWLEVGLIGNILDVNDDLVPDTDKLADAARTGEILTRDGAGKDKEFAVGGPMVRVRILRDREWWPELSVGGYVKWGTNALNSGTMFVAASKRIPIDPDGFFRSIVVQTGFRQTWFEADQGPNKAKDTSRAYGGLELELPYRFYLVGEITQKDDDFDRRMPFAYGLQCRLPGVALTVAAMQDGAQHERIGIFSGIGITFGF